MRQAVSIIDHDVTWDNPGVAYKALHLRVRDTASANDSRYIDIELDGESVFRTGKLGTVATTKDYQSGTSFMAGSNASDNGTDWCGIWVDQICEQSDRYSIGIGVVNRFSPQSAITAPQAIAVGFDVWNWAGLSSTSALAAATFDELTGISAQVSSWADAGKAVTIDVSRGIKVASPTLVEVGTIDVTEHYGIDILTQAGFGTTWAAIRLANANYIVGRNASNTLNKMILGIDGSDNVIFGDSSVAALLNGSVVLSIPPFGLSDGIVAPAAIPGFAQLYVDTADGDLKVKFGDGVTKTIATDV